VLELYSEVLAVQLRPRWPSERRGAKEGGSAIVNVENSSDDDDDDDIITFAFTVIHIAYHSFSADAV